MAIIAREKWKIHPKVIEFWEKRGKKLHCYGDYWRNDGFDFGGATYFYELDRPQIGVSSGDPNVIARHDYGHAPSMLYVLDGKRYIEEEVLKIIRLPAFI